MAFETRHIHVKTIKHGHGGDERTQNVHALVLHRKELDRLMSDSNWVAKQSSDAKLRQRQIEHMKMSSQNIVSKWNNTVLNKQKERLERRSERIRKEEDRKNAVYHSSLEQAAKERKTIIEDARRLILFDRDEIHQVNSAFVYSEVLREREKQMEFKKHLKNLEEDQNKAMADKIRHDTEVFREQEAARMVKDHDAKMERKALNIKMMKERAENEALLSSSEKEHEQQDLKDMEVEMKLVQENIEREIQRKRDLVKANALESIASKLEHTKMLKQEMEDEEKVIQIYCQVKEKMEDMRQKKEFEARQTKNELQERIKAIIAESLKEKEDDIDSMIDKANQEREQREVESLQKRQQYEAKLLKERRDYMTEVQNRKMKEQKEEKEQKQWIVLQRLKRDEMDKMAELKKKESQWARKMAVRKGYNTQIEQQRHMKEKELQEDQHHYDYIGNRHLREDTDFFNYAQEVIDECIRTNRPSYPVEKVMHDYRKRHGILQRESYERWVKENAELEGCESGDQCRK